MRKFLYFILLGSLSVLSVSSAQNAQIWVTRSDGGKSCANETAQSVEKGAEELHAAGIHVTASKKGSDGKMHPMMCGAPTGTQNVYQIPASELPTAIALGFKEAEKTH